MPTARWLVALVASTLTLTLTPTANAQPPAPLSSPEPAVRWITLITGDKVMVRDDQVVFSGDGGAIISQVGGHTMVVPTEAMPDVAAGRLDRTLFDVTTLIAEGYDDTRSRVLPVIVSYAGSPATARVKAAKDKLPGVSRLLDSIGARSASVDKSKARAFWNSSATRTIRLDRRMRASTNESVPQIGAPAAWERGYTGKGVKVAVLDTGIDTTHPDLAGKVAQEANFSNSPDTADRVGHGTHIAGIVAGTGAASQGKYRGVASDATLLNGKVLGDDGSGTESSIIAGMEWAVSRGADVVNMSLGSSTPSDGTDPVSRSLDTLSRQAGTLFVVASGNCSFPDQQQITSPAAADEALAVASLERDGSVEFASCRGPRKGDFTLKPEIAAPGVGIVAARANGTDMGEPVDENYTAASGTSTATPHVAGTAALLAQAQPGWTGSQLRARLISTADPQPSSPLDAGGVGRVDADQTTDGTVSTAAGTVGFGFLPWPHDSRPITKTVVYSNNSIQPVTLALTTEMSEGDTGQPPALSATQVTVPAAGQTSVNVTATPGAGAFGNHSGRIVATPAGGGDPLITGFGWFFEDERYTVTIRGIARDGTTPNANLMISRPDGKPFDGLDPAGTPMRNGLAAVRVPPGVLDISTFLSEPATDTAAAAATLVTLPEVHVTKDTTVTLDARPAVPVSTEVHGIGGLSTREQAIAYSRVQADGSPTARNQVLRNGTALRFFATPGAPVTVGDMEFSAGARHEVPPFRARSLGTGGAELPVADLARAPRFTGVKDLVATSGDQVRGKLALIRHDPSTGRPDSVLLAAQQAGAAAVLLFNPGAPGPDGAGTVVDGHPDLKVPTLRTTRVAAERLLALMRSRTVTVRITGVEATPVVYDLLVPTRSKVPSNGRHVVRTTDLARIDETFGAHVPGVKLAEVRFGRTPLFAESGTGQMIPHIPGPYRRTSYVSARPVTWDGFVAPNIGGPGGSGLYAAVPREYDRGEHTSMRWFVPVANSGLPDNDRFWTKVTREHGFLNACLSPLDNGADHTEAVAEGTHLLTFKRNGEPIGTAAAACAVAETPDGPAGYELSLDAQRETPWWKYSTRVRSTWKFTAEGTEGEVMPLILADLDVPDASALSQVKVGRQSTITLGLRHQKGSTAAPFTSARLEMSYDGNTWTPLRLAPAGSDRYVACVTHPVEQAGNAVHLRVGIADAGGGRLSQEVTRAFGLTR